MTALKICGLKTRDAVDAAIAAGATHIGINLFAPSPRAVDLQTAADLAAYARGRVAIVALLVDPDDALVSAASALAPDFLQLHGHESPDRAASVRQRTGLSIIKALGIAQARDLAEVQAFAGIADIFLLDAKPPPAASMPGGHGRAFDWSVLVDAPMDMPYFLAGGLRPETVGGAIAQLRPFGVDVSSGVERAPGVKDAGLIARFAEAVRQADRALA